MLGDFLTHNFISSLCAEWTLPSKFGAAEKGRGEVLSRGISVSVHKISAVFVGPNSPLTALRCYFFFSTAFLYQHVTESVDFI